MAKVKDALEIPEYSQMEGLEIKSLKKLDIVNPKD
jgi:hypothetical protein